MQIEEQVRDLISPLLKDLSIGLWDVECKGSILRILVDTAQGVDMETLSFISRILSSELDKFEPVSNSYTLEVSSPGLDRTLRHFEHYQSSLGSEISVKLNSPVKGGGKITGTLKAVSENSIEVQSPNQSPPIESDLPAEETIKIPFTDIKKAQILFKWDEKNAKKKGVLNG